MSNLSAKFFKWDKRRARAAQLVADGSLTEDQISAELAIGRATLKCWKNHPIFQERVTEIADETAKALKKQGIRIKETRLAKLNKLVKRIEKVIKGRAADMPDVPGGPSGLLVRDYKGHLGRAVYKFDAALVKEFRELLKQAAIELGEWTEKRELSGPDGGAIPVSIETQIAKVYGDKQQQPDQAG